MRAEKMIITLGSCYSEAILFAMNSPKFHQWWNSVIYHEKDTILNDNSIHLNRRWELMETWPSDNCHFPSWRRWSRRLRLVSGTHQKVAMINKLQSVKGRPRTVSTRDEPSWRQYRKWAGNTRGADGHRITAVFKLPRTATHFRLDPIAREPLR